VGELAKYAPFACKKKKSLADCQHFLYSSLIGLMYQCGLTEAPLALGRLLGQYMAVISLFSFEPARSSKLETLFCRAVRFHLWHCNFSAKIINKTNIIIYTKSKNNKIMIYFRDFIIYFNPTIVGLIPRSLLRLSDYYSLILRS
jgi:hypothetical protein